MVPPEQIAELIQQNQETQWISAIAVIGVCLIPVLFIGGKFYQLYRLVRYGDDDY